MVCLHLNALNQIYKFTIFVLAYQVHMDLKVHVDLVVSLVQVEFLVLLDFLELLANQIYFVM
ncbi:hypothetical protein EBU99_15105 [bacterium]|nr:hypothetical protein [bacterium]